MMTSALVPHLTPSSSSTTTAVGSTTDGTVPRRTTDAFRRCPWQLEINHQVPHQLLDHGHRGSRTAEAQEPSRRRRRRRRGARGICSALERVGLAISVTVDRHDHCSSSNDPVGIAVVAPSGARAPRPISSSAPCWAPARTPSPTAATTTVIANTERTIRPMLARTAKRDRPGTIPQTTAPDESADDRRHGRLAHRRRCSRPPEHRTGRDGEAQPDGDDDGHAEDRIVAANRARLLDVSPRARACGRR